MCPEQNGTCMEWTVGNTNWTTSSQRPWPAHKPNFDERVLKTKIKFIADFDKSFCEAPIPYRAPWIAPAESSQCLELSNQIMARSGYWKGCDWDGGYYQLARLADCEVGIARTDGQNSAAL